MTVYELLKSHRRWYAICWAVVILGAVNLLSKGLIPSTAGVSSDTGGIWYILVSIFKYLGPTAAGLAGVVGFVIGEVLNIAFPIAIIMAFVEHSRIKKLENGVIPIEEKKEAEIQGRANKNRSRTLKTAGIVAAIGVVLLIAWQIIKSPIESSSSVSQTTNAVSGTPFHFTSVEDGFEIDFPAQPARSEENQLINAKVGSVTSTNYSVSNDSDNYYVYVYKYSNPAVDESRKGFNVKGGLEGLLNAMLNVKELNLKLISSQFITFNGKQALQYEIENQNSRIDGIATMNGKLAFNIMLEQPISGYKQTDTDKFISSFKFNSPTNP